MAERCGDRQRKSDGLEKWPFRFFIESLPVMLQIALLLLACGLSRYVWAVNTSVAYIVIFFTSLGLLFYIAIVAAGTSSYECPFQTPASEGLRYLRGGGVGRKLLVSTSPSNVISLILATLVNARQGLVSASHRVYGITRHPLSWEISPSNITSGIRGAATRIGHQVIILLLHIDQALGNAKQSLAQRARSFRHARLLPTTVGEAEQQPVSLQNGRGLLVRVRNLEVLRKQNTDNARCVCWVLRNITDSEAIYSAVRLAGTIRWFNGDADHDPPFDLIVSAFEACFDSTEQLYPGMRDQAYFSARAILQISLRARVQSRECASKYSIPEVSSNISQYPDPDLCHVIRMLQCNFDSDRPTLDFPRVGANSHNHLLWMSNLFVDLTRMGPNPFLQSYESYLSAAITNHQAMIADTLLMWYMSLGGCIEEETSWAIDKSYVLDPLSFHSTDNVYTSGSLETILSHLSARVMTDIANGESLRDFNFLLEFLAAWEERPVYLTPMVYKWCSTISEVVVTGHRHTPLLRFRPQDVGLDGVLSEAAELRFSLVGPGCGLVRTGEASHHNRKRRRKWIGSHPRVHLPIILEVGFRLVTPGSGQPALRLDHTLDHNLVFESALSNHDDEVIADGMCAWIAGSDHVPAGSCAHYLTKSVENDTPFSLRLRRMGISLIERTWRSELRASELETILLLNRLYVSVDDMEDQCEWVRLLVNAISSPVGLQGLSIHYWHLLEGLPPVWTPPMARTMELVRLLEEGEDWEKLGVWMVVVWQSNPGSFAALEDLEHLERVTLKYLLQRPSALPRFEGLPRSEGVWTGYHAALEDICARARAELLSLEPLPL